MAISQTLCRAAHGLNTCCVKGDRIKPTDLFKLNVHLHRFTDALGFCPQTRLHVIDDSQIGRAKINRKHDFARDHVA